MTDFERNKLTPPLRLEHDLRRLESLRTEALVKLGENFANPIHNAANALTFGEADFAQQKYWSRLTSIDDALQRAASKLKDGDVSRAEKLFTLAETWIAESEHDYLGCQGELQDGALRGVYTAVAVTGTCVAIGTGGLAAGAAGAVAGGTAAAVHVGGAVWFLSGEDTEKTSATCRDATSCVSTPTIIDNVTPESTIPPVRKVEKKSESQKKRDISQSADVKGTGLSEAEKAERELEKKIRRKIRAVPKKYSLPPKEELIAWAKENLTRFQQNHDSPINPQLGKFFLHTEISNPEDGEFVENWKKMISEYKPTDGISSVEDLVKNYLFEKYLKNYSRGYAQLVDFMKGFGGNCEAETKMIIASIATTGAQLPEGWQLGVQSFTDHIQAVAYNKDTGKVQELLTGTIVDEIKAPIYHPYYLLDGYLRGQQASLSVSLDELLIADSEANEVGEGVATNSVAQYRGGRGRYSNGPIPEFAALSYGQTVAGTLSTQAYQHETSQQASGPQKFDHATPIDNLPKEKWEEHFGTVTRDAAFDKSPFINNYHLGILFKDPKYTEEYNALSSSAERQQYLITLAAKAMQDLEPEYRRFLDILQHPTLFTKLSEKEITAAIDAFHTIDDMQEELVRTLGDMTVQGGAYQLANERARIAVKTKLATLFPVSMRQQSILENFAERVHAKSEFFILFTNTLSPEKRTWFIKLLESGGLGNNFQNGRMAYYNENVGELLGDERLFGFGKKAGFAAERKTQQPVNEAPIANPAIPFTSSFEVELIEISQLPADVQKQLEQAKIGLENKKEIPGQKVSKGTLQVEQKSKYTIKPETMIEFIFSLRGSGLSKRWTPELSRVFLKMNRNGKYDERFKQIWTSLAAYYPKNKLTTPNPYYDEKRAHDFEKMAEMRSNRDRAIMKWKLGLENPKLIPSDISRILREIKKREEKKP